MTQDDEMAAVLLERSAAAVGDPPGRTAGRPPEIAKLFQDLAAVAGQVRHYDPIGIYQTIARGSGIPEADQRLMEVHLLEYWREHRAEFLLVPPTALEVAEARHRYTMATGEVLL